MATQTEISTVQTDIPPLQAHSTTNSAASPTSSTSSSVADKLLASKSKVFVCYVKMPICNVSNSSSNGDAAPQPPPNATTSFKSTASSNSSTSSSLVDAEVDITTPSAIFKKFDKASCRFASMKVGRWQGYVNLRVRNTFPAEDLKQFDRRKWPSLNGPFISVPLPWSLRVRRFFLRETDEMYVITTTADGTPYSSVRPSPSGTFDVTGNV